MTEKKVACHRQGKDVTLITYGTLLENVMAAAEILCENGIEATVLRLLCVAPLPTEEILSMLPENHHVVIFEEANLGSGIRESLSWRMTRRRPDLQIDGTDLGNRFVTHGSMNALYKHCGLDPKSMAKFVEEVRQDEK